MELTRRPLSHLSALHRPLAPLTLPGRTDTVTAAELIGGEPDADRRLFVGRRFLAAARRAAEAALTSRAVVADFGLHVRLVRDGTHPYEVATISGSHLLPEDSLLVRALLAPESSPGVSRIEDIHEERALPLGRGVVEREVLYANPDGVLFFEVADLLLLLGRAEASPSGWVQLHRLGVTVRTWQRPDGTTYQVCAVSGARLESVS